MVSCAPNDFPSFHRCEHAYKMFLSAHLNAERVLSDILCIHVPRAASNI